MVALLETSATAAREYGSVSFHFANEPRWFMGDHHMNPVEAVQAFIDSGAEIALAHHHGTFQLTDATGVIT